MKHTFTLAHTHTKSGTFVGPRLDRKGIFDKNTLINPWPLGPRLCRKKIKNKSQTDIHMDYPLDASHLPFHRLLRGPDRESVIKACSKSNNNRFLNATRCGENFTGESFCAWPSSSLHVWNKRHAPWNLAQEMRSLDWFSYETGGSWKSYHWSMW